MCISPLYGFLYNSLVLEVFSETGMGEAVRKL